MIDRSTFLDLARCSPRRASSGGARWLAAALCILIFAGVAQADGASTGPRMSAAVASGTAHACAVFDDGTVRCWGSNDLDQIGAAPANLPGALPGVTSENQPQPVAEPLGACDEDFECPSGHCDADADAHACTCTTTDCPFASACSDGLCLPAAAGTGSSCPWGYAYAAGACAPVAASALAIPEVPSAASPGAGVPPPVLGDVMAVAAGDAHTCALVGGRASTPSGSVWCWGENSAGQLGAGDFDTRSLPVRVTGIAGASVPAIAITAGAYHTCALLADGTDACWGDDNQLQLGAATPGGGPVNTSAPRLVPGVSGATAVAAGADHTCALLGDGSVTCWGGNASGQAGQAAASGGAPVAPTAVSGLSGTATAIAAGRLHTCALVVTRAPDATSVQCWGGNASGQLGNRSTADSASPVTVDGVHGVRGLVAGGDHACALHADGTVACWGDNGEGQVGIGAPGNASTLRPDLAHLTAGPTAVPGLARVRALSAGYFHTCATLDDGSLTCWGSAAHGQLGDNAISLAARGAPGPAANFGTVAPNRVSAGLQIASGYFHNCVLGADGRTSCWGGPTDEDLGTGSSVETPNLTPVTATVLPVCTASGCAGAIAMCGGYESTCSLLSDGTVWCWGLDVDGELGNGIATSTLIAQPVQAALAGTAVQLSCGLDYACALLSDGTVQCWGNNGYAVLGNGASGGTGATPGTVLQAAGAPLDGVTFVAASPTGAHACALRGGGSVYCWGYALVGQIGPNFDPTTFPYQGYAVPVGLSNGKAAKTLALGAYHSCALASDGTAQCWGDDFKGALGDNNPDPTGHAIVYPPATVGLTWLTGIAAGYQTTCAVRGDGSVWCWGDNASYGGGAVGTGDLEDIRAPVSVVTQSGAPLVGGASVTAGFYNACILRPDGTAACWGYDGWGELGNGNVGTAPGNSYAYAVSVVSSAPVTR